MQHYLYVIGILTVFGGLALAIRRALFMSRARPKTAVLTGWENHTDTENDYSLPIVQYVGRDGKMRAKTLPASVSVKDPQVGDKVDILIEAKDDDSALPEGFIGIWSAPIVLLLLGAAALYIATRL